MTPSRMPVAKIGVDSQAALTARSRNGNAIRQDYRQPAQRRAPHPSPAQGHSHGRADREVTCGRRVLMKAQPTYEIRIAGRLDETTLAAFAGLEVMYRDEVTLITGQFDQAALHGILEMIRSLGLDLLEARRLTVGG